jgi:hypothetical protein
LKANHPSESRDDTFFASINDVAFENGYCKRVTEINLKEAVQTILYNQVYYKRKDVIQHIKQGFNAVIPSNFGESRDFLKEGIFPKTGDLDISLESLTGKIIFHIHDHQHIREAVYTFLHSKISKNYLDSDFTIKRSIYIIMFAFQCR